MVRLFVYHFVADVRWRSVAWRCGPRARTLGDLDKFFASISLLQFDVHGLQGLFPDNCRHRSNGILIGKMALIIFVTCLGKIVATPTSWRRLLSKLAEFNFSLIISFTSPYCMACSQLSDPVFLLLVSRWPNRLRRFRSHHKCPP